jgi:hypothetical protein
VLPANFISLERKSKHMVLIVNKTVINIFKEPNVNSERISQAKIGEPLEELKFEGDFVYVRSLDKYEGWVMGKGLPHYDSIHDFFGEVVVTFKDSFSIVVSKSTFRPVIVPMGSFLPLVRKERKQFVVKLPNGNEAVSLRGEPSNFYGELPFKKVFRREKVLAVAKSLLNVPYLWGGTTPFGLDCSGFVQLVYRVCGYNLKRDAHLQFKHNGKLIKPEEAKTGDLVFFSTEHEEVDHVAMIVSKQKIVHSTKKYNKVVEEGIERLKKYIVGYKTML